MSVRLQGALTAACLLAACPLGAPTVGGYPIVCQTSADCGPGTSCDFSQGTGLCLATLDGGDAGPDAGDGGQNSGPDAGDAGDSGVPDASIACAVDGDPCAYDGGNVCLGMSCISACLIDSDGGTAIVLPGALDPLTHCASCQPARDAGSYSPLPDGTVCDAGGGNVCQGASCMAACVIDGGIKRDHTLDPSDPGSCCNASVTTADWVKALTMGVALTTANPPLRLAAADLDGDGILDLVVVEQGTLAQLEIFKGDGTGRFASVSMIDTGAIAVDLAVGDFNGDGRPDIAVLQATARVEILTNLGDAGFDAGSSYPSPTTPTAIIAANLYSDAGPPDLAVIGFLGTGDMVSVAENIGGMLGSSLIPYPVGNKPVALASGHYSGSSANDLVVANALDQSVSVLVNSGGGAFPNISTVPLAGTPTTVATLSGDSGVVDEFAVGIAKGLDAGNVAIGSRLPDAGFAVISSVLVGPSPSAIGSADFNGDARPDLAVTDSSESTLRLLFGVDGGFTVDSYSTGPDVAMVVGDFNGDGRPDLAVASGDSKVTIFLGQCP